jgi:ribonuclease M5
MKIFLDGTLVVEGKEDASYLSNFISSEIVIVNGYELSKSTIAYLKNKKVILLLDPDEAGSRIRERLNKELPNAINVEIDISKCIRGEKNGVAECQIEEIMQQLSPYVVEKHDENSSDIKMSDLYELGLINNKDSRDKICQKLNLGNCNGKQLFKRLTINNISLDKLREIIEK